MADVRNLKKVGSDVWEINRYKQLAKYIDERCHLKPRVLDGFTASRQLDDEEDLKILEMMSQVEEVEIRAAAAREAREGTAQRAHEN